MIKCGSGYNGAVPMNLDEFKKETDRRNKEIAKTEQIEQLMLSIVGIAVLYVIVHYIVKYW